MDTYTESSGIETSPDMNSSLEMASPERSIPQPRKLTFGLSPEPEQNERYSNLFCPNLTVSPKKQMSISPPYRRVRALRLFDTPATPKTIIQKLNTANNNKLSKETSENIERDFADILAQPIDESTPFINEKPRSLPIHNKTLSNALQTANVNPFTPSGMMMHSKKRSRVEGKEKHNKSMPQLGLYKYLSDDEFGEIQQAPKRLALQDTNISRYEKEFVQLSLIGAGEFGHVFKCLNRLDGCTYAIKRSKKPVAGSAFERIALNEVWAHAVLGKHDNVVRYYSAWAENNHMLIQNEYCNGGSLQSLLQERCLTESELRTLLIHIAEGLKYIHSNDLVHMDLKAGNIFLTKLPPRIAPLENCDDGFEDIYEEPEKDVITYKIGDLGHVTSVFDPQVEEGDCRYLPNEILQDDFSQLSKADIFSLGITLYEAAGGGPLPKNGPEWHRLRDGNIPLLQNISSEFNDLIRLMTHPMPKIRPSSTTIFNHPLLCTVDSKTKAQLTQELSLERQKNEILLKELKEAKKILKSYELSKTPVGKRSKSSPHQSDRKLRSYSKKKRSLANVTTRRSLRDRNKNIIEELFS